MAFSTMKSIRNCLRRYSLASNKSKVVLITGCDSGLGFSLAQKVIEEGSSVVAGCLNPQDKGALLLKNLGAHVLSLDVTDRFSVSEAAQTVSQILENTGSDFHGVVNNAAIMIFGEFEWQTPDQICHQINVNLVGSMIVAYSFLPLLRRDKGRLINIISHCAIAGLPGLTIYGATKAGLQNWNDSLRIEQSKYGVKVVSFIPGSFYGQSGIMSKQDEHASEMLSNMSGSNREFHQVYFNKVNHYLAHLPKTDGPQVVQDEKLIKKLMHALFADNPNASYKHEPLRYAIYHKLFKSSPIWLRDYLVRRFVSLPKYS